MTEKLRSAASETGEEFEQHVRRSIERTEQAISTSVVEAKNAGDHLIHEGQRSIKEAGSHLIREGHHAIEEILASLMAKVLAVALAVGLLYGAYLYQTLSHKGIANMQSIALLFWGGTTLLAIVVAVAWRLCRGKALIREFLVWELYIVFLAGLGTVVLLLMELVAPHL